MVLALPAKLPITFPVTLPVTSPVKEAVIVPALKLPLASLLTKVLGVLFEVAEAISLAMVVIVEEPTPPTVFTLGRSPVPPKSPANCIIPFEFTDASGAALLATLESTKAAVAISVPIAASVGVVAVGVPVKEGDEIVLFVKVSAPVKVASVPVVGRVTVVGAVLTNVVLKLPEVVKSLAVAILPPKVIVLPVLFTPVPPYCPAMACAKSVVPLNELPYIVLAVCNCVVVLALPAKFPVTLPVTLPVTFPVNVAVTVPALKLPLASL